MALDASADKEHGAIGSLFGQLLKKPSQEQIVLLLTLGLLVVFSFTLPGFSTVTQSAQPGAQHFHSRASSASAWG